jgi:hypothetical protein
MLKERVLLANYVEKKTFYKHQQQKYYITETVKQKNIEKHEKSSITPSWRK